MSFLSLLAISRPAVAAFAAMGILWGTFAAAIFPVLAIGLNWKGATSQGAIVAIVSSLLLNVVINVAAIQLPNGMNAGFLAFVTSIVLFIGVSLLSRDRHTIDDDIDQIMDF